jgi:hypothetical protein
MQTHDAEAWHTAELKERDSFKEHNVYEQMPRKPVKPPLVEQAPAAYTLAATIGPDYVHDEDEEVETVAPRSMTPVHSTDGHTRVPPRFYPLAIAMLAVIMLSLSEAVSYLHKFITKQKVGILFVLLGLAMACQHVAATPTTLPMCTHAHSFISHDLFTANDKPTCREAEYEWCSDSGSNRFVTNDESDFVPGTIVVQDTIIAVGGGNVVSKKSGTVLVVSEQHNHSIYCTNVLLLETCSKKLMPVSIFTAKGCATTYTEHDVHLVNKEGTAT